MMNSESHLSWYGTAQDGNQIRVFIRCAQRSWLGRYKAARRNQKLVLRLLCASQAFSTERTEACDVYAVDQLRGLGGCGISMKS